MTEKEVNKVITIATSEEFKDASPREIVPKLADKGKFIASESTFYRVLKRENMLAHRGKSRPKKNKKPIPLMATSPNEVWTWDITYLRGPIKGSFYYLYMFMDIFSRKIVHWEVQEEESMERSSKAIRRAYKKENILPDQIKLHSDNGGPMKGVTMLATLKKLGVLPSFGRPSVSDDNPYSEALFKTLKYCPQYPSRPFKSIEEARSWVDSFVDWYNNEHLHSGIKFVTPSDRHNGLDREILEKRREVYKKAKEENPLRWSKEIRDWKFIEKVFLNPLKDKQKLDRNRSA